MNVAQRGLYNLVLRLLQDQSDVGAPKRAVEKKSTSRDALLDPTTGAPVVKVRKPDLAKLTARIEKEMAHSHRMRPRKNGQIISRSSTCMVNNIIRSEAIEKGFIKMDSLFAAQIAEAALVPVVGNIDDIRGIGYCDMQIPELERNLEAFLLHVAA